jgi:predicted transposase/invertase (TIGR01784 family)
MGKSDFIMLDWAATRLFRQKSNFVILEGFLSALLGESIHIKRMLESEGNKENPEDKFNRVDMLAENSRGEMVIIEVQNNRELNYFHRMLYGTSKVITEYISEGQGYAVVKKVYSVNIVYFDLGQGDDYVYHGQTEFRGIHTHDVLQLSANQQKQFVHKSAGKLFPEYYVLRVDEFDKKAVTPLDEWISFLKTGHIPDNAKAEGLPEARERLRRDRLSKEEQRAYDAHVEALRYQRSVIQTGIIESRQETLKAVAKCALKEGMSLETIIKLTGLTGEEITSLMPRS